MLFGVHIKEHRLILLNEYCNSSDKLLYHFSQNHFTNKVDRASSSVFLVCRASVKFLIFFYALCRAKVELGFTVGTVKQSRKQTFSARGCVAPAVFSQFLNAFKSILVNNCFLGIVDNLPLVLRIDNLIVYLVAEDQASLRNGDAYGLFLTTAKDFKYDNVAYTHFEHHIYDMVLTGDLGDFAV